VKTPDEEEEAEDDEELGVAETYSDYMPSKGLTLSLLLLLLEFIMCCV